MKRLLLVIAMLATSMVTVAQPATDASQLAGRGQWVRTSAAPIGVRSSINVAWSGDEIFVFGGMVSECDFLGSAALCAPSSSPPLRDGAAYSPSTDSWRLIADAPVGITASRVATIGSAIYILAWTANAENSPRLLRYQTVQDEWGEVELPDNLIVPGISAFGSDLLLYSTTDEYGAGSDWLLDTSMETWELLPDDPLGPGFSRWYIAHGNDLYLFDKELVSSPGGADGPSFLRAARYRNQQWSVLPTSSSIGPAPTLVSDERLIAPELGCADGGSTNNFGRCIEYGAVFNTLSDTWSELPNAPGRGTRGISSSGGISAESLVLSRPERPAFDATTDEWFFFPPLDSDSGTQRNYHAVERYGFVFGGISAARGLAGLQFLNDSWIWRP